MSQPRLERGAPLTAGRLFRRINNLQSNWDLKCGLPKYPAFQPGKDRATRQRESGISTYLEALTFPAQVLAGHHADYGLTVIDIAELHVAVAALRGQQGVKDFGEFRIFFDPLDDPNDGEARHAHCYIEPMPPAIQKEVVRLTSPSRVVKPCGPLQANSGSLPGENPSGR